LLETALDRLAPQRNGTTDIYTIGIAGWSQQDVFRSELWGALGAMSAALPIGGRSVTLVNHRDTVEDVPIATHQNFASAVRAVGRRMDKDEDVLMLIMTSHGARNGLALYLPGVVSAGLTPEHVATILDQEGIKHRILIISACYAGVFLKHLANENTIIISAADENSPSFGCSNEREWTYFGDAFFNHAVRSGKDFQRAFMEAKVKIAEWEARDGLSASNPQAHFGEALLAKLRATHAASVAEDRMLVPAEE